MYVDNRSYDYDETGLGRWSPHRAIAQVIQRTAAVAQSVVPKQLRTITPIAILQAQNEARKKAQDFVVAAAKQKRDFMMQNNIMAMQQRRKAQAADSAQAQAAASQAQTDAQYAGDTTLPAWPPQSSERPSFDASIDEPVQYDQPSERPYYEQPTDNEPAYAYDSAPSDSEPDMSPAKLVDASQPYDDGSMYGYGLGAVPAGVADDKWATIASSLVGAWQQKKLVDTNIERMKAGLQPLDIGASGVGVQATVNIDPQIKRMLMIGGLSALALGAFVVFGRRGR